MGFRFKRYVGCATVLLGVNFAAPASSSQDNTTITILVIDSARVSPPVLGQSEVEAARIFRAAGIETAWVNCPAGSESVADLCRVVPGANQFVLHIVPTGKTSTDSVFGVSFLGEDGSGKYSNVFYERVAEAHHEWGANLAALLGTVAAHELGHLLLGSHAHSYIGIMAPVWEGESLRQIAMGGLHFTQEQSSLMRTRLGRAN
ncbi:MAG TPA: hypothetical protein VFE61_33650 [Candidatus Sulfotelmatobacter sp.]|jgi:hypothetical protein|nr:hypothetical protein [Candidatus Sulfotelmatobacter sp.]